MNLDQNYISRELGWLDFNQRVLDQATGELTPLLERLRFLGITGSNLDEFFMVRVGGLMIQAENTPEKSDIVGRSAAEQLQSIRQRVEVLVADQYQCLKDLLDQLAKHGIRRIQRNELTPPQIEHLRRVFEEEILSIVSPIAVDDAHNFPAMIGATFGLCVRLRGTALGEAIRREERAKNDVVDEQRFAVMTVRRGLKRIWTLQSDDGIHFVLLEDILSLFAEMYFPGQEVLESVAFRTMRNADVAVDEGAADLLAGMKAMLHERKTGYCVRLELDAAASDQLTEFLIACLEISGDQLYRTTGPIDLSALTPLASAQGFRDLKFEPWLPQPSPDFQSGDDIFEVLKERDRVLIHPYQDYQPVVDFVVAAAQDPQVIAIKQTLYRTSKNSEIVNALRKAAENGKHVTVIVELKARFDEQRNIDWARKLEDAGVDVVFGVRGLKTHAKLCLVVRKEAGGVRRYIHFGTGNYNESTARAYGDISFFTCDSELGVDSVNLFNAVTGLSVPQPMTKLVAAPVELRQKLMQMMDVEIASAKNGRPAVIRAKFNSLVDQKMIDQLYRASQAGVIIDLNVRGICCLRPGVPGLSENIRVISIVDRFLEHARIFYFLHGGDHRMFISSADWMGRNLDRRIELMIPVAEPHCAALLTRALQSCFDDNTNAYRLESSGTWTRLRPEGAKMPCRSQQFLQTMACEMQEDQSSQSNPTFQPHRSNHESA